MSTIKQVLIDARALIADPAHWCKGVNARKADGCAAYENSEEAVQWCAYGAAHHAASKYDNVFVQDVCTHMREVSAATFQEMPSYINDHKGHAAILEFFDAAIAAA